jgi:hypothetical protein
MYYFVEDTLMVEHFVNSIKLSMWKIQDMGLVHVITASFELCPWNCGTVISKVLNSSV